MWAAYLSNYYFGWFLLYGLNWVARTAKQTNKIQKEKFLPTVRFEPTTFRSRVALRYRLRYGVPYVHGSVYSAIGALIHCTIQPVRHICDSMSEIGFDSIKMSIDMTSNKIQLYMYLQYICKILTINPMIKIQYLLKQNMSQRNTNYTQYGIFRAMMILSSSSYGALWFPYVLDTYYVGVGMFTVTTTESTCNGNPQEGSILVGNVKLYKEYIMELFH